MSIKLFLPATNTVQAAADVEEVPLSKIKEVGHLISVRNREKHSLLVLVFESFRYGGNLVNLKTSCLNFVLYINGTIDDNILYSIKNFLKNLIAFSVSKVDRWLFIFSRIFRTALIDSKNIFSSWDSPDQIAIFP